MINCFQLHGLLHLTWLLQQRVFYYSFFVSSVTSLITTQHQLQKLVQWIQQHTSSSSTITYTTSLILCAKYFKSMPALLYHIHSVHIYFQTGIPSSFLLSLHSCLVFSSSGALPLMYPWLQCHQYTHKYTLSIAIYFPSSTEKWQVQRLSQMVKL